nr:Chain A, Nonstructural protein 5A [synthetic construct]2AJM_A Chain A, Nonstructural protein 5A [synthetic construct]2AJN_A Chain A, Nonstructural protein 5A [synthetic construct]2AJO_A Chain A, Nonstructural protein 5A [synthetic construct]
SGNYVLDLIYSLHKQINRGLKKIVLGWA